MRIAVSHGDEMMNALTLNRKIATTVFDDNAFRDELISAIESLLDSELQKPDAEISFELIDFYSEALNKIYAGERIDKIFISLQTVEELQNFIKSDKRFILLQRGAKIALAACAVLALTFTANYVTEETTGYNFLEKMAQAVKTVFTGTVQGVFDEPKTTEPIASDIGNNGNEKTENPQAQSEVPTTESASKNAFNGNVPQTDKHKAQSNVTDSQNVTAPHLKPQNPNLTEVLSPESRPTETETETETTTREPFTRQDEDVTAAPVAVKLVGTFDSGFKRSYKVGESADFSGLTVTAVYDSGEEKTIPIESCNIYGFSTETAANRIVTVEYEGCSFSYLIRVS